MGIRHGAGSQHQQGHARNRAFSGAETKGKLVGFYNVPIVYIGEITTTSLQKSVACSVCELENASMVDDGKDIIADPTSQ